MTAATIAVRAGLREEGRGGQQEEEDGGGEDDDNIGDEEGSREGDGAVLVEDDEGLGLDEDGLGELVEVDTDVDFEHLPPLVTPTVSVVAVVQIAPPPRLAVFSALLRKKYSNKF